MVKECSLIYKARVVGLAQDSANLMRQFLGDVDRKHFLLVYFDTKDSSTVITICHIGYINFNSIHPSKHLNLQFYLIYLADVIVESNQLKFLEE